jgi:hypothetical protein
MLKGEYLRAADTVAARFAAVELAMREQNWDLSQHLELIPGDQPQVVSNRAKTAAAREELEAARLRRLVSSKQQESCRGGRGQSPRGRCE